MLKSIPLKFSFIFIISSYPTRLSPSHAFSVYSQRRIFSSERRHLSPVSHVYPVSTFSSTAFISQPESNKYDIHNKKKGKNKSSSILNEDTDMGKKLSKTQMKKNKQLRQAIDHHTALFNNYYIDQYGQDRWTKLKNALAKPVRHVAMGNKYVEKETLKRVLGLKDEQSNPTEGNWTVPYLDNLIKNIFIHESDLKEMLKESSSPETSSGPSYHWPSPSDPDSLDSNGLYPYYPLDAASLLPVILLQLEPHHSVLDVCSAPGGKALAILQSLELCPDKNNIEDDKDSEDFVNESGSEHNEINCESIVDIEEYKFDEEKSERMFGQLICNDVSFDRRMRLRNVISNYLPPTLSKQVRVRGYDASSSKFVRQISFNNQKFDRILLDAPCASERHLIQSGEEEITKWSVGRSRNNSERQLNLLLNSLSVLKSNGILVYSTCAVTNIENDMVIEKMLAKIEKKQSKISYKVEIQQLEGLNLPFGEKTKYGWHILPDNSYGWGPIYLTVIKKVAK